MVSISPNKKTPLIAFLKALKYLSKVGLKYFLKIFFTLLGNMWKTHMSRSTCHHPYPRVPNFFITQCFGDKLMICLSNSPCPINDLRVHTSLHQITPWQLVDGSLITLTIRELTIFFPKKHEFDDKQSACLYHMFIALTSCWLFIDFS